MNCTARRRARMMARILSPCVSVASTVATHSTLLNAGSTSSAVAMGRSFAPERIQIRSGTGAMSISPRSSAATPSPKPPVFTVSTSDMLSFAAATRPDVRPWLVDFGFV